MAHAPAGVAMIDDAELSLLFTKSWPTLYRRAFGYYRRCGIDAARADVLSVDAIGRLYLWSRTHFDPARGASLVTMFKYKRYFSQAGFTAEAGFARPEVESGTGRNVSMDVRPRSLENRDHQLGVGLAAFAVGQ